MRMIWSSSVATRLRPQRRWRGWFEYFKHTNVATVFPQLDGRLRRRLRRILLTRRKQHRHQGRGYAHQRWPNAYFAEHGLYSLVTAHALARQTARPQNTNWRAVCGRTARAIRREG